MSAVTNNSELSSPTDAIESASNPEGTGDARKRPRIVIAEDFVLIQEHIKSLLKRDCEVVAAAEDGESALSAVVDLKPDVLLIDVSLPGMNGFAVTEKLRELGSSVKVVFVTAHSEKQYSERAFEIGAKGYVLKGSIRSELLSAIRTVMEGEIYRSALIR
jgi:DNA-binding NarL/FixJ family response regulator